MTTRKVGLFALVVAIVADPAHDVARGVFAVVVVGHRRRAWAHCRPHWASRFFFFFVVWLVQRMRPDRVNLFDFLVFDFFVFVVFVVVLDPEPSLVRWDGLNEIIPESVSVGGGLSVKVTLFLKVEPIAGILDTHEHEPTLNTLAAFFYYRIQAAEVDRVQEVLELVRDVRKRREPAQTLNHLRNRRDSTQTSDACDVPADREGVLRAPVVRRISERRQAPQARAVLALRHNQRERRTDEQAGGDRSDARRVGPDHRAEHHRPTVMNPHDFRRVSVDTSERVRLDVHPKEQLALVHLVDEKRVKWFVPAGKLGADIVEAVVHRFCFFYLLGVPVFFSGNPVPPQKFSKHEKGNLWPLCVQRPTDRVQLHKRRAERWAARVDFKSSGNQNGTAQRSNRSHVVQRVRENHMTPPVGHHRARVHAVPRRLLRPDLLPDQHNGARPRRLVHRHKRSTDAVRGLDLQPFGPRLRRFLALRPPPGQNLRTIYDRARVTIQNVRKNDAAKAGGKSKPEESAASFQKHARRIDRLDVLEHSHTRTVTNRAGARHVVQRELPGGHLFLSLRRAPFFLRPDWRRAPPRLKALTRERAPRSVFDRDTLGLKSFKIFE